MAIENMCNDFFENSLRLFYESELSRDYCRCKLVESKTTLIDTKSILTLTD